MRNIQLTWTTVKEKISLITNMIIIMIRKVHTAYMCGSIVPLRGHMCREKEMKTVECWSLNCSRNEILVNCYQTDKSIVVIIKHDSPGFATIRHSGGCPYLQGQLILIPPTQQGVSYKLKHL